MAATNHWFVRGIMNDEQRPLFTIAVLVSGVVGGLAVVITVVYLYRFCLKKRPPVTTTGKPEQKREHVRSDATSNSRPLPLPLDTNPLDRTIETSIENGSFGSPTRLSQVFPLMNKEQSYVQRPVQGTTKSSLLSVVADPPSRARSADLLAVNDQPDNRRASCDVPRGTGRQLPSTEGLEKQYVERQRRMSTLARSDAVQGMQYMPRKQNSSPLPEFPRIYERGHAHSRSWNPGYNEDVEARLMEPLQYQYDRIPQREVVYREPQGVRFIPKINEPELMDHSGRNALYKQAKSFDVSTSERRLSFDRRTTSLVGRVLPPAESAISAACHSLWAARGHLEQLHALGISDPSSASTSFDSNTDSHSTAPTVEAGRRVEDAEKKRSKYKSLLIQRNILSTAAVSSMDSTNSVDSSGPDPLFASSMDSSGSDLEQRRLSLMNRHTSAPHMARSERDYSVDEKSSNLFREFSRVEKAYDTHTSPRVLQRRVTHDEPSYGSPSRRPYHRQYSIAAAPLICYADENSPR